LIFLNNRNSIFFGRLFKLTAAAIVILAGLSFGEGGTAHAQEKNKYEKQNQRKNKSNRRIKRRGDKGKSNNAKLRATKFKSRTRQGEKSYSGDITGRKVITKTSPRRSSAGQAKPNPYAGRKRKTERSVARSTKPTPNYTKRRSETAKRASVNPRYSSKGRERAWKGSASGRAIKTRSKPISFTGRRNNKGVSFQSISRSSERSVKSGRVRPRSASGNYNVRKRKKPYAFRQKKPWEKSFKGDITGRTFRTKRTVERPVIKSPSQARFSRAGRKGDRPYSGGIKGGFNTATKKTERAWKKDISGNKLRIRTSNKPTFSGSQFQALPAKKSRKGEHAYKGKIKGGNYKSVSSRKESTGRRSAGSEPPGQGTARGFRFQGNIKAQKPLKGGGSISGRLRNNQGKAIQGRGTTGQDIRSAKFLGNIKSRKPLKGGGSISNRSRSNQGKAIQGRGTTDQDLRSARFLGNIKSRKPLKGGGSISNRSRSNQGKAIQGRGTTDQDLRSARFLGNIKSRKPLKGGGSISNRSRNNQGKAIQGRGTTDQDLRSAKFLGNIKSRKPLKGGGSISNRSRNNQGKAIQGRGTTDQDLKSAKFLGNIKARKPLKGGGTIARNDWNNRGQTTTKLSNNEQNRRTRTFQGNLKLNKPLKGGGSISNRSRNNEGKAIQGRGTTDQDIRSAKFLGNIKARKPLKGGGTIARNDWNNRGRATTKLSNNEQNRRTRTFQGNLKLNKPAKGGGSVAVHPWNNKQTPINKPEQSGTGRKAANFEGNYKPLVRGQHDALASFYKGDQKRRFNYKQNPNTNKNALKVRVANSKDDGTEFKGNVKPFVRGRYDALASIYKGNDKRNYKYDKNPITAKEALKVKEIHKNNRLSADFQGRFKMANYSRNKENGVKESLKGIGPSRAAIQASNYQGNIKMSKKSIDGRHPSHKYARISTTKEKEKLFSIRLLFSKLFKKNEGQPDNLKEKIRTPRYDKRDKDIWYD
jgi:hypothetical protein